MFDAFCSDRIDEMIEITDQSLVRLASSERTHEGLRQGATAIVGATRYGNDRRFAEADGQSGANIAEHFGNGRPL